MPPSHPSSADPSRTSTPNPATASRFTAQNSTAEDLLKSQTVGLVHLSDFRKRRAEVLEQKVREAQDISLGRFTPNGGSGTATPTSDGASTPQATQKIKKKKRKVATGKLSFGAENESEDEADKNDTPTFNNGAANGAANGTVTPALSSGTSTSRAATPKDGDSTPFSATESTATQGDDSAATGKFTQQQSIKTKRLGPNATVPIAPKVMTKSALLREAQTREQLRKEFLVLQEAIRETEFLIPFVFYDGTNIPGGVCKVKKGDPVWLFLDKARKVGAELGVAGGAGGAGSGSGSGGGGGTEKSSSRREWARVGVDDLLMVRGEIIIPHHFDFYYFIVDKIKGPSATPLFDYSSQPTTIPVSATATAAAAAGGLLQGRGASGKNDRISSPRDEQLEGFDADPTLTKVVDRRWYERNKHIFPASVWEEFDPEKDYSNIIRRDAGGNAFFFR
ncbi:MAG: hypothetical protein M1825_003203 [Sarcosagium campestre]|nr:MAG: hypothetical protein M1825_003203 [Sarcosagium campestre]